MGILIILIVIVSLVSWILKTVYKNRLKKGLGRKVKDSELTSLSAWMNAAEKSRKE